ncbi:hypothetical protein Tco_0007843 [Tanacetum coccineum]
MLDFKRTLRGRSLLVSRAEVIENQESVGSHDPRVILLGAIPAIIPIIPEVSIVPADPIIAQKVGAVLVVSPTGVLDLVDYSSSFDSDPSEDSLPPAPDLPLVSPFLCSDDSEADGESEPAEQRPVSSSHDTLAPLSEFPLAPVVAPPGIRRRPAILRVRPIPARRLAWRRVSHHSSDRHSSPDSSSSSSPSDHSLSGHTPPDTTDADSSTPQRFVHRSLARTPRHSEAFRRWRSAPLSTPYPPTTSESSLGSSSERSLDSSSPSSRPSRKRCRSPTASVPSPTHVSRSIAPTPADLLPPRKRFRDSYSPEDSGEEHMEVDTADAEAVADVGISEGVVAHPEDGVGMGFEIAASDVREDDEEFEAEASAADTREIAIDPLTIGDSYESSRGIERDQIDSLRLHMALLQEEFRQVYRDRDETWRRLKEVGVYVKRHLVLPLDCVNNDLATYTQRFQELTMMCTKMVSEEEDLVEKFIGGLPDNIQRNVITVEPTRLQDAVRIANNLMDQKLKGYAVKKAKTKDGWRSIIETTVDSSHHLKGQVLEYQNCRAYTAGNNEKKPRWDRCTL